MASYMSELGYLNNPVSNFVQTADVNNQPVNSLALIAARYAGDAVEVFSLMVASHMYALCQAVDLRQMHKLFEAKARKDMADATSYIFGSAVINQDVDSLWTEIMEHWNRNSTFDLADRAETSVSLTIGALFAVLTKNAGTINDASPITKWQARTTDILMQAYTANRKSYLASPKASLLCTPSTKIYNYVRGTLNVPMHKGLMDHPTYVSDSRDASSSDKKTIGSHISTIYAALREGQFMSVLLECWLDQPSGILDN